MALPENAESIRQVVEKELEETPYACSSLIPLSGGTANFIFKGALKKGLPAGIDHVVIKHGEAYVALNQTFEIPTSRCQLEEDALKAAERLDPAANSTCIVRTPRLFYFNPSTNTQVQECLHNGINLKNYALQHYGPLTPETLKPQCQDIGRGIGKWLRGFHSWVTLPEQSSLRDQAKANTSMQSLKHMINYGNWLIRCIDRFPDILADSRGLFEEIQKGTQQELEDEANLQTIHGDFWTGNVLIPDAVIKHGEAPVEVFIIDWEMCQLGRPAVDVGQMIAEMYELTFFKDIQAGVWMIQGLASGYGFQGDAFAFRAALHVGAHLVAIATNVSGWGTPEQVRDIATMGRDILSNAWLKNRDWFSGHPLKCLFEES